MEYTMGMYKEFEIIKGNVAYDNYNSFFNEDKKQFDSKYLDPIYLSYRIFSQVKFHSIGRQGYSIGNPPSVSGWQAYYQEPIYDLIWINSDSIKRRKEIAESIAINGVNFFDRPNVRIDLNILLKKIKDASNINAFIRDLASLILGVEISEKAFVRIKKSILGDNFPDYYWSDAVKSFQNNPNKDNYNTLNIRVGQILAQIFDLNEIHVF
jgi:hypothetical protein